MSTEAKVDPYASKGKRKRKPSKRKIRLAPQKFDLKYGRDTYVPLRDRFGSYVNAQPYAWVSLDDGGERDNALFRFGVKDGKHAIREGLSSLSVKNEKGTLPQIDFEVICPTALDSGGGADDRVDLIKRGTRLYVFFGYTHAISKQGVYYVKNKSGEYSEGVITLKVTAVMGRKLNMTTTSNIIRGGGDKSNVLDKLAGLSDHKIDYSDLLEEEIAKIQQLPDSKGSNMTVGQRLWSHVSHLDVDFWINPTTNRITLATPYIYDLKNLGKEAIKITYGLPNSNIRKITYSEKLPNKKNSGKKKGSVGNTQDFAGGSYEEKTGEAKILKHGFIRIGQTSNFLPIGNPYAYARHVNNANEAGPNDLTESQFTEKYSDTKTWVTTVDDDFNLDIKKYKQYKVKKIIKGVNTEELDVNGTYSLTDYRGLVSEGYFLVITNVTGTSVSDAKITVRAFTKNNITNPKRKNTKKSKNKGKPKSTTVKTDVNQKGEIVEVEEFYKTIVIPRSGGNAAIETIRNQNLKELNKLRKANKTPDGRSIKIEKSAPDPTSGVVRYTIKAITQKEAVPVRENPKKPEPTESKKDTNTLDNKPKGKESVATSSSDGKIRGRQAPSSKGGRSGNGNKTSRRSERELTIELASGDWTLPLGTVIELIDVNDSVSGFYVVNSEQHKVGSDGFTTTIKCSIGISKTKIKKTSSSSSGSTRKDASNPASKLIRVRRKKGKKKVQYETDRLTGEVRQATTRYNGVLAPVQTF